MLSHFPYLIQDTKFSLASYIINPICNPVILYKKPVMVPQNAEVEAQRTWRDKETSQPGINPDRSGGARQASSQARGESLSTHRDDRTWGDFINQCGQATIGGIVDQLISRIYRQIEDSENRTAELKSYVTELEQLSKQLQNKTDHTE
jgi:hypothetical protein